MGCGEEHAHWTTLGNAEERSTLRSEHVHYYTDIVHTDLEARQVGNPIR